MTTTTNRQQQAIDRLHLLTDKYMQLVWYARSMPTDDPSWEAYPSHIKEGALNSQARVEEHFPDETDSLACPDSGDWEHGFNSGMLAAARLLLAYLHPQADGAEWDQQIEDAEEEFPALYI
ncbi:hypothetical protein [Synechococcus sp. CS-205]|uniref:hypothetical protein n=1 Tax=Synechococcus sp. CS-205 TaxID=2847984 RepID=UPI00223B9521|nr:hypothetical protein [Synechococcus sp. CS-205]MCT0247669.1 hypothetical protein [Synechococcus sp. CS-205]